MKRLLPTVPLLLATAAPLAAQTPLQPAPIDITIERAVMAAAVTKATGLHAPSSIAIADSAGDLVQFQQMDGARQAGITLAMGKARSAARFRIPTENLENAINGGRAAAITAGVVEMRGGVPIVVAGKIVGAIGVSGVDNKIDVQVAAAGAAAVK
jgi:glc operon protein GlcG